MSSRPLLEGRIEPPDEQSDLRKRVDELEREVGRLREDCVKASRKGVESLLRQMFSPLHRATAALAGEAEPEAVTGDERANAVWESWKQRLGGGQAKAIDALLLHGSMNTTQLAIATGLHRTTIPKVIFNLNKAGLLNKNGGNFSLKELS